MPVAEPGDEAIYIECVDPECPAHREGYGHAHLDRIERAKDKK